MMLIRFFTLLLFTLFPSFENSYAFSVVETTEPMTQVLPNNQSRLDQILHLTPKRFRELTGRKMNTKERIALHVAKKEIKKGQEKMAKKTGPSKKMGYMKKEIYILLALIGLGIIGVGENTGWSGNDWVICLILSLLTCIGGMIYALIKMQDYY